MKINSSLTPLVVLAILSFGAGATGPSPVPPPPPPPTLKQQLGWSTDVVIGRAMRLVYIINSLRDGPIGEVGKESDHDGPGRYPYVVVEIDKTLKPRCGKQADNHFYISARSLNMKISAAVIQEWSTRRIFLLKRSGTVISDPKFQDQRKSFNFRAPPFDIERLPELMELLEKAEKQQPNADNCK